MMRVEENVENKIISLYTFNILTYKHISMTQGTKNDRTWYNKLDEDIKCYLSYIGTEDTAHI